MLTAFHFTPVKTLWGQDRERALREAAFTLSDGALSRTKQRLLLHRFPEMLRMQGTRQKWEFFPLELCHFGSTQ